MFVKWECGCIGLHEPRGLLSGESIVVIACDVDRDAPAESLTWFSRDMSDKDYAPVEEDRAQRLHQQLAHRLAKADRFDTIRLALAI